MEQRKWVKASWARSDQGRRIKEYALTPLGRSQLRAQAAQWHACVTAMTKVLGT